MLVSIITIYYNRHDKVNESIGSLLSQTYTNIEVIAIDDGSTDGTYEALRSIRDNRLRVYRHDNMGFTNSIIKAIELAKGSIIAIHGSGDLSHQTRIEKQLYVLSNDQSIGVVGCYVQKINTVFDKSTIHRPAIPDKKSKLLRYLKSKNPFTHGEVMFRKDLYNEVGGYRPYFKYAQDRDLWMRMALKTKFAIVPEVLYTRYSFSDGVSNSAEKAVTQKFLNELSRQCVELKEKGKSDLIESYGNYAPFFMKRSSQLANDLAKRAIVCFYRKELENANKYILLSRDEKNTVLNFFTYIVLKVSMNNRFLYKLATQTLTVMKKLMSQG